MVRMIESLLHRQTQVRNDRFAYTARELLAKNARINDRIYAARELIEINPRWGEIMLRCVLSHENGDVRRAALEVLWEKKKLRVADLIELIVKDPALGVKNACGLIFREIKPIDLVNRLIYEIKNMPKGRLRLSCISSFIALIEHSSDWQQANKRAVTRAVEFLNDLLLYDPDPRVKQEAARNLMEFANRFGDYMAVAMLFEALNAKTELPLLDPDLTRRVAAYAVKQLDNPAALKYLKQMLDKDDLDTLAKDAIVVCLGQLGKTDLLLKFCHDSEKDPAIRAKARKILEMHDQWMFRKLFLEPDGLSN